MKNIFTLLFAFFFTGSLFAQTPEKMSYQAVVRDGSNELVINQNVGMQISILQGTVSGISVYTETQTPTTNSNGLISLEIGSGTYVSGAFSAIDWSAGPYFIKTETDPNGGTNYTITGTSQLMSVPYALYAKTSGNGEGPQGPAGVDGNDGATGATGPQGPAGVDGNDGATGAIGSQGPAGADGNDGATGPQGPAGADGNDGATGPQGPAGVDGNNGATGPQGPAGVDGNNGATGPAGPAGNDGATGATGTQGPAGADGNDGATGATGPQGPTGTSYTPPIYNVNTNYAELGGYVIAVRDGGKHGLVVAMQDQGSSSWYEANDLLSDANNHDVNGAKFMDWRLPTKRELNLVYNQKSNIGGFASNYYWSSTEYGNFSAWRQNFDGVGSQNDIDRVYNYFIVRAVRAF